MCSDCVVFNAKIKRGLEQNSPCLLRIIDYGCICDGTVKILVAKSCVCTLFCLCFSAAFLPLFFKRISWVFFFLGLKNLLACI